ncbi:Flp pilus assembly complex ATPase component TadA [Candidatus Woesearchaeota archaeon]|nr:Flp pilus assembly complex ATPase component TadA [Candidatus Woesearchaeota archaeon]
MDNLTKAKYLNMLIKMLSSIDDAVFSTRANAGKNDYSDWILKNIKDGDLANEIKPLIERQKLIGFISSKVKELTEPETPQPAPTPPQKPSPIPTSSAPRPSLTAEFEEKARKELEDKIRAEQEEKARKETEERIRREYEEKARRELEEKAKHDMEEKIRAEQEEKARKETEERIKRELEEKIKQDIEKKIRKEKEEKTRKQAESKHRKGREGKAKEEQEEEPLAEVPSYQPDLLRAVDKKHSFVLQNGHIIRSLTELEKELQRISQDVFSHHVNEHKNDFAAWIYHIVNDADLAEALTHVKNKEETIMLIKARINELNEERLGRKIVPPLPTSPVATAETVIQLTTQATETKEKQAEKEKQGAEISKIQIEPSAPPSTASTTASVETSTIKTEQFKPEQPQKGKSEQEVDLAIMSVKETLEKLNLIDYSSEFIAVEEEVKTEKKERKKIKTGVYGFDDMISDGIPTGSTILLSGGPGSGKTTFAIQMLGWAAEHGEKCLFMTFEESEENLIEHMEAYGLDPRKYLQEGTLMIQRQDPFKISRMIEALLAHARGELMIDINSILNILPPNFKPDRVVIDSLSAISAAFSDSSTAYRIYVTQLIDILERTGATSFLITEVQGIENIGHGLVEEFLADGVIVFYNLQKGNLKQSALEILKMRAVDHLKKIVPFEFVKGKGIRVYPLEKIFM